MVRALGRLFVLVIVFLLFARLFSTDAWAASYYVDSSDGDDNNSGTSQDTPWQSISKVNSSTFIAGDTVYFKRGGSWSGGLTLDDSGMEGNPITFTSYGEGNKPIFDNPGELTTAITVNASWLVFENLQVQNATKYGIRVSETSNHNIFRSLEITEVGEGIGVFGQSNLVTQSNFHDLNIVVNTPVPDNDDYGAVGVALYNSNNEVSYNTFENCRAESADFGYDGGAVELYGDVSDSDVHHNISKNNEGFAEIGSAGDGTAANNSFSYNISLNDKRFLLFSLGGDYASEITNTYMYNNTIVQTEDDPEDHPIIYFLFGDPTANTLTAKNNIIYSNAQVANRPVFTHGNNIFYLTGGADLGFTMEDNEKISDPLFVDLGGEDFQLQAHSPAIEAGEDVGLTLDYTDNTVPFGALPDAGAYEYQAQSASSPWTQTDWSGGKVSRWWSSLTRFLSSLNVDETVPGQISLSTANSWYNNDWDYRKKISIDKDEVSGGSNLSNFPVLVSLTDTDLKDVANEGHVGQSDGGDLVFTSSNGTSKLAHQIEEYVPTTGKLVVWVQVPTLSVSANTDIYLYYGNAGVEDQWNNSGVWNENYQGVWHLTESGDGTDGEYLDATVNDNHGQGGGGNVDYVPVQTTGKISNAQAFDGANDYINVEDDAGLEPAGDMTIEAWVKLDTLPSVKGETIMFVNKVNGSTAYEPYFLKCDGDDQVIFDWRNTDGTRYQAISGNTRLKATDAWYHLAAVKVGASLNVYINGVNTTTSREATSGDIFNSDGKLRFGANYSAGNRTDGVIDEIRFSNTGRSAGWIATSFNNQFRPSAFFEVAAEETPSQITGTLTSSIFDTGQASDWGVLAYSATTPDGTSVALKARTSNNADMSGANEFSSCDAVDSGSDLSDNNCAADNHRYVQYQAVLSSTNIASTASLSEISINFSSHGAPSISAVSSSVSSSGGVVTWATNKSASSRVEYGLTDSYGLLTDEENTESRITSHSISLTDLLPCTTYHYRVRSRDTALNEALGEDGTLTTSGCTGSASVLSQTASSLSKVSGGSVSLLSAAKGITLTVPENFAGSDANFQIKNLNKTSVFNITSTPSGYSAIGSYVYDLKAVSGVSTAISSFNLPVTVSISYGENDILGVSESSLRIYRWDGSRWHELSDCSVNTASRTVTGTTSAFSIFGLFGQSSSSSADSSSASGDSSPSAPVCDSPRPGSAPYLFEVDTSSVAATLYFAPGRDPYNKFYIAYGREKGNWEYGVEFAQGKSGGAIKYTINYLSPNTTYYFTVRAGNGCMPGEWGNVLMAKTGGGGAISKFYPNSSFIRKSYYQVVKKVKTVEIAQEKEVEILPVSIPTQPVSLLPTAAPTPKKRLCIFRWCF